MSSVDDGGQAFPISDASGPIQCGLTMRDWFAGQALAGMLSSMAGEKALHALVEMADESANQDLADIVAMGAFEYADAMLAARNKNTSGESR